jgi:hypothetical protein
MNYHRLIAIGAVLASTTLGGCAVFGGAAPSAGSSSVLAELRDPPPSTTPAAAPDMSKGPVLTVAAPSQTVGSEWHYDDGYGLRVAQVDGMVTQYRRTDDPSQWVRRRAFLREDSQSQSIYRKLLFSNLPPDAGAKLVSNEPLVYHREFASGGVSHSHLTSWTVEGRERVAVPAGEFDCWVLVMRTRSLTDDWTGFERWWYSPQVKSYVRLEYQYGRETGSRVLTQYALAGPGGAHSSVTTMIHQPTAP